MNALTLILEHKRAETARQKSRLPHAELVRLLSSAPAPRSFTAPLLRPGAPRFICEVKRASPSKGVLLPTSSAMDFSYDGLARAYEKGGASCLSVLTDIRFFWGAPDALMAARTATSLPCLRKDFLLEPYQIDEARWLGADAVLLIARMLDGAQLHDLHAHARGLGMEVLVEVHDRMELERALALDGALLGINHRDLDTMQIDRERALRLLPDIPKGRVVVAESGLRDASDVRRLFDAGIPAFLVGESVATAPDPAAAVRALVGA